MYCILIIIYSKQWEIFRIKYPWLKINKYCDLIIRLQKIDYSIFAEELSADFLSNDMIFVKKKQTKLPAISEFFNQLEDYLKKNQIK